MTDYFSEKYLREEYNRLAETYAAKRSEFDNADQLNTLERLIPNDSAVLDIGCGAGLPVAAFFAERGDAVIGIDVSDRMIELSRANVPGATFRVDNVLDSRFPECSFDLAVSFYTLFHIRREKQAEVFNSIFGWLKPGGYSYFTLAAEEYTSEARFEGTLDFDGVRLPYSHHGRDEYREIFDNLDFTILSMDNLCIGGETMLWVLLRKPLQET